MKSTELRLGTMLWLMLTATIFAGVESLSVQPSQDAAINVLPVRGNVYMLVGAGGNIAVSLGRDGALLVDSGSSTTADAVIRTVEELLSNVMAAPLPASTCVGPNCTNALNRYGWSGPAFNPTTVARTPAKPIRYIINTTIAPDHTGGNASVSLAGTTFTGGNVTRTIADSGVGAAILAHDNLFLRMSELPVPSDALPTETYLNTSYKLTHFFNGEGVQLFHLPAATTDGDTMVWFRYSDVISSGDVYSTLSYPVIDVEKGGTIQGVIDGLNRILDVAYAEFRAQGGTMIIPGHGRLSDVGDVANYRNMVAIIRDRIQNLIDRGMTLEDIQSARITLDYDGRYGSNSGAWTTEMFIEAVYRTLSRTQ